MMLVSAYKAEVEFRNRTYIDDFETRVNIANVAKFLTQEESKFGIMLCGTCGNGKTTMLYAFRNLLNFMYENAFIDDKDFCGIRIIDAKEVFDLAKNYDRYKDIRNKPMVGIEDMGREPTEVLDYGNVLSPIVDMLEYRYDQQLFTFITTNLTPKEVSEKYGTRIASRFQEMLEVIVFKNITVR